MKTNTGLKQDVLAAISWEPLLKQSKIDVKVDNGIVTLSGVVDSFIKKSQTVETTKKIIGVKAIIENINVEFNNKDIKSDNELAVEVLNALRSNKNVPFDRIQIEVENGHVTLNGKLEWNHQKVEAQRLIGSIDGIKVLTNHFNIENDNAEDVEQEGIERAIIRNWALNHQDIHVCVSNKKITLNGIVHSFYQKQEAERMAWNAPGVLTVDNKLMIEYDE